MKVQELVSYLETLAPNIYQEGYDNSGLLVGDSQTDIRKALICLDSTEDVIDEAIAKKCRLVIAHHPIIFGGLKKLTGSTYIERVVMKAIKADIAVYAIHTNLDNVSTGVNRRICDRLRLKNCSILVPRRNELRKLQIVCSSEQAGMVNAVLRDGGAGDVSQYPLSEFDVAGMAVPKNGRGRAAIKIETLCPVHLLPGVLGALDNAGFDPEVACDILPVENINPDIGSGMVGDSELDMSEKKFLEFVRKELNTDCIRYTALRRRKVRKVAVCGGSGSFLLPQAIQASADIFITGDFKYHQFFDAEDKIVIADVGHYESEQFTKELIRDVLREKFPNFALVLSETNTNPIKYLT